MSMNNANISITADNKSAIDQTRQLTNAIENLNKNVSDSKKVIADAKSSWSMYAAVFNQYYQAFSTIAGGIRDAMDFGKEISKFESVQNTFSRYASSIGADSDAVLKKLKTVSGGVIDDFTLMQSASNAMAKGVATDSEKLAQLWQVSSQKAKIFGKESSEVFNNLINAINKGSKEAFQEVGIKLPESFEKASKSMTNAEKTAKLLEIAIADGKKEIAAMGGELNDSSDSFAKFDTAMKNLKTTSGTILLPALTSIAEMLTQILTTTEDVILGLKEIFKNKPDINYSLVTSKSLKALEASTERKIADYKNQINTLKVLSSGGGAGMPDSYRSVNTNLQAYENQVKRAQEIAQITAKIEHEENNLATIRKEMEFALTREAALKNEIKAANDGIVTSTKEENSNLGGSSEKTKQISDNTRKALESFANLADTVLPKMPKTEAEAYDLLVRITAQAGGIGVAFGEATGRVKDLNRELEDTLSALNGDLSDTLSGLGTNKLFNALNAFDSKTFGEKAFGVMAAAMPTGVPGVNMFGQISGVETDVKGTSKKSFGAIANQLTEVIISGVNGSNFADTIGSAISSIASQRAQSYGSTFFNSLFSGGGIATGALTGFVGNLALGAISSSIGSWWESISHDKNREQVKASTANTIEKASYAYLNTYSAMLNPFLSWQDVQNIESARWNPSNSYHVSWKWEDTDWHWLTGQSEWYDTTPKATFDTIERLTAAVEEAEKNSAERQKQFELLEAQGKSYQALTESLSLLESAFHRAENLWENPEFNWSKGEHFELDLSDSIQDLKVAYYDALKQYGQETANRTTQAANNFLNLFPFLDDSIYGGTNQYVAGYEKRNTSFSARAFGISQYRTIYGYQDYDTDISNPYSAYSYITNASNQLADRNANRQMLELVKQSGANQYNLSSLQYTDSAEYEKQYIEMLERSQAAAELVMREQEQIYLDATQTFEQQSAALQMYQEAQNQYYNAKLEILAQEQAKEEQIKKEEAAANLRRQEQMEALLGFTGEIARTGNNVYILEGADQIGALKEMIQQYGDDPEVLAALQAMLSAAQSKAKFGKIA